MTTSLSSIPASAPVPPLVRHETDKLYQTGIIREYISRKVTLKRGEVILAPRMPHARVEGTGGQFYTRWEDFIPGDKAYYGSTRINSEQTSTGISLSNVDGLNVLITIEEHLRNGREAEIARMMSVLGLHPTTKDRVAWEINSGRHS